MSGGFGEAKPRDSELSPLDEVAEFVDANQNLMRAALAAHVQPDTRSISEVIRFKKTAVASINPLIEAKFFSGTQDEEIIETAVGAVMRSTESLWETATVLKPDDATHLQFGKEIRSRAMEALSSNMDPESEHAGPWEATVMLSNTYERAAENLFTKLMATDSVNNYYIDLKTRAERRKQLISFGAVAVATFLGTAAARLATRKK